MLVNFLSGAEMKSTVNKKRKILPDGFCLALHVAKCLY